MATPWSWRWRASSSGSPGRSCATTPGTSPAVTPRRRTDRLATITRRREPWRVCGWWKRDGLTVNRCPGSLCRQMALDADPFMRTGTRGSPSWPGSDPETGYVDADCSDQGAEAACRRGGPYVDGGRICAGVGAPILPRAGVHVADGVPALCVQAGDLRRRRVKAV